jgi:hypothetical protein
MLGLIDGDGERLGDGDRDGEGEGSAAHDWVGGNGAPQERPYGVKLRLKM